MLHISFSTGKSGRGPSKAKNKKADSSAQPSAAPPAKTKEPFVIPKRTPLLELDSDDEEIGQGKPLTTNKCMKFSNVKNPVVSSVLNSSNLLSKELISLSSDLERLLMYSATQQT